ncbi:MAG: bifunctional 5,10-methylenetetrahydrofolate dehydrogenase/5,10-methenyltetrahydrofolate cyclohydrolase [bacterium]
MQIIDGRKLRDEILEHVSKEVAALPFQPVFSDILVGGDPASLQYVRMKEKTAESAGIRFERAEFPATITTDALIGEIQKLNAVPHMCGIIAQLPLPVSIDIARVLDSIDPELDVDCLGAAASARFYGGLPGLGFPTALACMKVLESLGLDLAGKKIAVLGQGQLVGRPVTALLRSKGFAPVAVDNDTPGKEKIIEEADVIISGIGRGNYITGDMIKEGAVLVDAGTSESGSGIVGDIDRESVAKKAACLSPVPGGVGPVTVAMLLENVLAVAKRRASKDVARHDSAESHE